MHYVYYRFRALIGFLFLSLNRAYAQFDFNSGGSVYNELSNTAVPLPEKPYKAVPAAATAGNDLLVRPGNGEVSFDKRAELIRAAKKRVYLTELAVRGDGAGRRTADLLIAKKKEGLDVRLTIDKKGAGLCGTGLLAELSAAGIQVRLYKLAANSPYQPYSRMLVIDGKCAVLGINSDNRDPAAGGQKIRYTEPPAQSSALDDAVVFFFQASDSTGTTNQKLRYDEPPVLSSALDDSVVFFFQASDGTDTKE